MFDDSAIASTPITHSPAHPAAPLLPPSGLADISLGCASLAHLSGQLAGLRTCLAQLGPWCAAAALGLDLLGAADGGGQVGAADAAMTAASGGVDGSCGSHLDSKAVEQEVRWGGVGGIDMAGWHDGMASAAEVAVLTA